MSFKPQHETHARTLGLSVEAYEARLEAGERWCWGCEALHPVGAFGPDRSRPDGRARLCRPAAKVAWERAKARKGPPRTPRAVLAAVVERLAAREPHDKILAFINEAAP